LGNFFDRITGKDTLIDQINVVTNQLKQVDNERQRIWSELNRVSGDYNSIKNENAKLRDLCKDYASKFDQLKVSVKPYPPSFFAATMR
jgi:hypothetical protein